MRLNYEYPEIAPKSCLQVIYVGITKLSTNILHKYNQKVLQFSRRIKLRTDGLTDMEFEIVFQFFTNKLAQYKRPSFDRVEILDGVEFFLMCFRHIFLLSLDLCVTRKKDIKQCSFLSLLEKPEQNCFTLMAVQQIFLYLQSLKQRHVFDSVEQCEVRNKAMMSLPLGHVSRIFRQGIQISHYLKQYFNLQLSLSYLCSSVSNMQSVRFIATNYSSFVVCQVSTN